MEIEKSPGNTRITVLIITTIAAFLVPFMSSAVNIALPEIGHELSVDAVMLGWVATVYALVSASLLIPFGRLADIYGRRKVFAIGTIIFSTGSILCALASSILWLILSRAMQGIGSAMVFGTSLAMLTSAYPLEERGRVLGINVASSYVGLSLGPFLGGLLTDHAGWRSIFMVGFVSSFPIAIMALSKLRTERAEAKGERFDYGGGVIFAALLTSLIYGLTTLPDVLGILLLVGSITMGFIFVAWENRAHSPLLQLDIFKNNRAFTFSNIAALISYSSTYAITFLLSLYLQYSKGLSPEAAGLVLVTTPAVQSIFSPIAGRLSDWIEPRTLASAGMAVTTVGLGLLIFVSQDTSITYLLASLLIIGFGAGIFISPNTNAVMTSVSRRWYGVASATMATSRHVGFMLSMGITMLLFSTFIGPVEITPEYYGAFLTSARIAFVIFTALCFAGIFASLARGNIHQAGKVDGKST